MDVYRMLFVVSLASTITACGSGSSGNSPDISDQSPVTESARSEASNDIYNPDVYDPVAGLDEEGVYLFIQRGNYQATITDHGTAADPNKDETHIETVKLSTRRVVHVVKKGLDYIIVDPCFGTEFGSLKGDVNFEPVDWVDGRLDARYTASESLLPNLRSEGPNNPLYFGPPRDDSHLDFTITDYEALADFSLIRLGSIGGGYGLANVTYFSENGNGDFTGCALQSKEEFHYLATDYDEHNEGGWLRDYFEVYTPGVEWYLSYFQQGDALILGEGLFGTGELIAASFDIHTAHGSSSYVNQHLEEYGETGEVSYTEIGNDSWGVRVVSQMIPSESAFFPDDAIQIDYDINWYLK